MAYYSGIANDMAAVRQALIDACVGEGWGWSANDNVIYRNGVFLNIVVAAGQLRILGRTGLSVGDAPRNVYVGSIGNGLYFPEISYPVTYNIFVFSDEVYCIVNYSIEYFQWLAWGKSSIALPGTGMWFAGTAGSSSIIVNQGVGVPWESNPYGSSVLVPLLFWSRYASGGWAVDGLNYFVHSDLNSGWNAGEGIGGFPVGVSAHVPLISILPNAWNTEAVLLPARVYITRPEGKISLVVDAKHARLTRVDNFDPGQIIVIGSERWKVYPFFRKNTIIRNGAGWRSDHTGTVGWAIRYDGP